MTAAVQIEVDLLGQSKQTVLLAHSHTAKGSDLRGALANIAVALDQWIEILKREPKEYAQRRD